MNKAESHYQLGLDYYQGIELPQDTDLAIDYLIKASELNHEQAKILCADLLFKQAKDDRSIYFEDGYRLGTEYMVDLYRSGKIDVTLPYLLNNELFNSLCTLEELQKYYQVAYRLGYRETKFELAKLLYKNGSYHSSEQWFLDSVKEDISKEAHLYLYNIYNTKECYNEKKALVQFKEAIKYGFITDDYKEFSEDGKHILLKKSIYESKFSMDRIRNQVASVSSHCYYADDKFKRWLTEDKILVRIYFDLDVRLLNAAYDYTHSDDEIDEFVYEPVELGESYFTKETKKELVSEKVVITDKDSGFYQSTAIDDYIQLEFREVFDRFGIKEKNPKRNTNKDHEELQASIQADIREDIKNKNRDRSKSMKINVKKFNLYKSLIPSFDFKFTYNHEEFISKRYGFDSPEWKQIFQAESDKVNYKAIKLDIEFPLNKDANIELEQIKQEVPRFKRKAIYIVGLKIASISLFIWSLIIFVQNMLFRENLHISTYIITRHISRSVLWYLSGLVTIGLLYYVSRIKIYDPSMTNLRQRIIDDPSFVLPQMANVRHFRKQYIQMILFALFALVFFLSSGFLRILR